MSEGARPVHQAVMLEEAVAGLNVRADGTYVDGTFGRGGHSRRILQLLGSEGRLIAIDRDLAAVAAGRVINDARFTLLHGWFGELRELLAAVNVARVDGILLDLGVSSPQLDEASRGFSFRFDAPLDMRMDQSRGVTAGEWLLTADESEIREVIKHHGEERFAKQIAAAIVAARTRGDLRSTRQLATLVAHAVPSREPRQEPATRTFQALRIHVNRELEELSLVLPQCVPVLNPGGRLAVVSFHSLEDRIVKQFVAHNARDVFDRRAPFAAPKPMKLRALGRFKPSALEIATNPRARSAVMRVAQRLAP